MSSDIEVVFSADLTELSRSHTSFLRALHGLGISQRRPSAATFRRYRDLWLPLVAKYDQIVDARRGKGHHGGGDDEYATVEAVGLVPPSDVAWLWHCHRLAPHRYTAYLRSRITAESELRHEKRKRNMDESALIEADPPFSLQHYFSDDGGDGHVDDRRSGLVVEPSTSARIVAATNAQLLWDAMYPAEPFFLPRSSGHTRTGTEDTESDEREPILDAPTGALDGFDLVACTERQGAFLWQVSGPRFDDDDFLADAVLNYGRFLRLHASPRGRHRTIVPTYQIDLMWHTHILADLGRYRADCRRIMGHVLHHDDSLSDRSEGSELHAAFGVTQELWREAYGSEYAVEGGMYRGEPPSAYYEPGFFVMRNAQEESDHNSIAAGARARAHGHSIVEEVRVSSTDPVPVWPETDTRVEDLPDGTHIKTSRSSCQDGTVTTAITRTNPDGTIAASTSVVRACRNAPLAASTQMPPAWVPVTGRAPDGKPAFIPPEPKSSFRGQNANRRIYDYVFGRHDNVTGYFHISTKEANCILYYRLLVAQNVKRNEAERADCAASCCFFRGGSSRRTAGQASRKHGELEDLDYMVTIAAARAGADCPIGAVGLPPGHLRERHFYSESGRWSVPLDYANAAACGASKMVAGGACAGGAGPAACGAAGAAGSAYGSGSYGGYG